MTTSRKCPILHGGTGTSNKDWWPDQINLSILTPPTNGSEAAAPDKTTLYAQNFSRLSLSTLKSELRSLLPSSQPWWPSDYGHYGPFFIRLAWHAAGTYRISDGRGGGEGGQIRFAPLNSWPDNGNLDKARRLLWGIKKKYGKQISWGDLIILSGTVALEDMGLSVYGFGGGRVDDELPQDFINWGLERVWLEDTHRYPASDEERHLSNPLAAVQMGLIYVNPEGPASHPDPLASAADIRTTFGRMAMNDEETVALVAGGHTFGKCHGAGDAAHVGREPEGAELQKMGLGWENSYNSGKGGDTITSGIEGAWTAKPTEWDNGYFYNLLEYEWELMKSPAGAHQWKPKVNPDDAILQSVPMAHDSTQQTHPIMTTADMALKYDPIYCAISKRFYSDPKLFAQVFAKAWFKLTHRDMGPYCRLLGPDVPPPQLWQDVIPVYDGRSPFLNDRGVMERIEKVLTSSGIAPEQFVATAWAAASSFRNSDKRGGANGGRLRLAPQKDWEVNNPTELSKVLSVLEGIQQDESPGLSMADLIVFAGGFGVERSAALAGHPLKVSFTPGRMDASQDQTDVESFAVLEPLVDGFRNYVKGGMEEFVSAGGRPEHALVDRASLLSLTAREMVVLVGGLRVLGVVVAGSPQDKAGVLTHRPGLLTNDYFVTLCDNDITWTPFKEGLYQGRNERNGDEWMVTRVDLIFGSHSVLRAYCEEYACEDGETAFVRDFGAAFAKVMNLDRYDLHPAYSGASKSKL